MRLFELAVTWLFEIGYKRVRLGTTPDTKAERFYQARGWTRIPRRGTEAEYELDKSRRR